jgi:hypothetical protein
MERAMVLIRQGKDLPAARSFSFFLKQQLSKEEFLHKPENLKQFALLDDDDIFSSIKEWCEFPDKVLALLCKQLRDRNLPKIEIAGHPFSKELIQQHLSKTAETLGISEVEATSFVYSDSVMNKAYSLEGFSIKVAYRDGRTLDIAEASDQLNITALTKPVTKYFLCYPKK